MSTKSLAKVRGDPAESYAPERIRTSDLRFRRPTLYPAELRALEGGVYRASLAGCRAVHP